MMADFHFLDGMTQEERWLYCTQLTSSGRPEDVNDCFLIAVYLRKNGKKEEAYKISEKLAKDDPSLKSYNIYLASALDLATKKELKIDKLADVFYEVWDFYQKEEYEPNITATLLRCCNYLENIGKVEKEAFGQIYQKCPEQDRVSNSYILVQYFRHLVMNGNGQQAVEQYRQLPQDLRANRMLVNTLRSVLRENDSDDAIISNGLLSNNRSEKGTKTVTLISNYSFIEDMPQILRSFSLEVKPVDIGNKDIISSLNKSTFKATIAIVVLPTDAGESYADWAFVLGYCVHKFGKDNIFVAVEQSIDLIKDGGISAILRNLNAIEFHDKVEFITQLGNRGIITG